MPNEQDTRDDNWKELLNLEDIQVKTLTDGDVDSAIFEDWIDKNEDSIDYMRFRLEETAKICLTVNADTSAKYTLYRYANGELESIQTDSLSKNKAVKHKDNYGDTYWEYPEWDYSASTKARMLSAGEYFLCVKAKDKTIESRYNVYLAGNSAFFTGKGDPLDNDWSPIREAEESEYDLGTLEDKDLAQGAQNTLAEGWVGYGDQYSWRKFTLRKKARLSFTIYADDASKFTLWRYDEGKNTLKSVLTAKPKKQSDDGEEDMDYERMAQTDPKLLKSGVYFFSVESTNHEKGGNANFSVYLDPDGEFFGQKGNNYDDSPDDVLKDDKYRFGPNIMIEDEWVGCDDEYDYRVFSLDQAAILSFTINASGLVKFSVFELATDKKDRTYRKKILSITPGKTSVKKILVDEEENEWEIIYPEAKYSSTTSGKLFEAGKDYFICVQSKNAAKGGSADYSLYLDDLQCYTFDNVKDFNNWTDIAEQGFNSTELDDAGMLMLGTNRVFSGWVGYGDEFDYCKFSLGSKAKLKFQINADDSVKFTIYKVSGIEGRYSKKQVYTSTTTKSKKYYDSAEEEWIYPEWSYSKKTAAVQLAAGDYVICVQSKNAAKGGHADFEVNLLSDQCKFDEQSLSYNKVYGPDQKAPDDGWNNWLMDTKMGWNFELLNDSSSNIINADTGEIRLDQFELVSFEHNGTEFHNWVGQKDTADFAKITLDSAAKVSFSVDSTDAAMFSIWRLTANSTGTYSTNAIQSAALVLDQDTGSFHVTTQGFLLEAGTYYVSMQSLNPKIGGSAYYIVTLDQTQSVFFDKGNNSDDWTDMKYSGPYGLNSDLGTINGAMDLLTEDWVGYGDEIDYKKFTLDAGAKLAFTVEASDNVSFSVCKLEAKQEKKGGITYSLTTIQTTTIQLRTGMDIMVETTKALLLDAGEYYISVKSMNAVRGGSADYTVRLNMMSSFSDACALDMPEDAGESVSAAASDLAMPGASASSGLEEWDLLAASGAADALKQETLGWQDLATLA